MINQSGSSRTGKHSYSYTLIQIVLWALLLFLPLSVLRLSGEEIFGRYLLVLGLQTLTSDGVVLSELPTARAAYAFPTAYHHVRVV